MADVRVNIVNGSGQKVTFTVAEDGDFLAHLRKQYRAGEFESLDVEQAGEQRAYPEGEPSSTWKVAELRALAAEREVDLGDATKKDDILAALAVEN